MTRLIFKIALLMSVIFPTELWAQEVGSTCYLERAIDFVLTQDDGDVVILKLSAGESLRVVAADGENLSVLWGNYESVIAYSALASSCDWLAKDAPLREIKQNDTAEEDPWSSAAKVEDPRQASEPLPEPLPTLPTGETVGADSRAGILVFPLRSDGVPEKMASMVTTYLVREIRKLEDLNVLTVEMLPGIIQERFVACSQSERAECYEGVAEQSGMKEFVRGAVRDTAEGRSLELRRTAIVNLEPLGSYQVQLDVDDNAAFLRTLGNGVESLFSGVNPALGRSRGVSKNVLARLNPPPIPAWLTYTVGSLAVVAGAAAGATGYLAQEEVAKFNSPDGAGPHTGTDFVDIENRAHHYQSMSHALLIGAGATLAVTGIMAWFTNWDGFPLEP